MSKRRPAKNKPRIKPGEFSFKEHWICRADECQSGGLESHDEQPTKRLLQDDAGALPSPPAGEATSRDHRDDRAPTAPRAFNVPKPPKRPKPRPKFRADDD